MAGGPEPSARLRGIRYRAGTTTTGRTWTGLVSAIHPTVTILADKIIEAEVWINAGSTIGYKAEVRTGAMTSAGAERWREIGATRRSSRDA